MNNNNNSKKEDFGACGGATSAIPPKISYMGIGSKKNEVYYFGNPPKKPNSLSNFLKRKKK